MPVIFSKYRIISLAVVFTVVNYTLACQEPENIQDEDDTLSLEYLLRGPDVEYNLNFALLTASAEGHVNQIRWLIKNGADVNVTTSDGATALHFAVGNDKAEAVRVLLEYKPNMDVLSSYSESPIHIAVKKNNMEIAEILARAGANLNIKDRHGATPLHYASAYGFFSMVDLLLYYEAPVYAKDNEGTTPLMAAVWAGYAGIADLLMQNGADPSEKDREGFNPFLIAAQNGDTVIMELLIKRFVNIYETNNYGYNALDLCIMSNHKAATEYLLRKGEKWNSSETSSYTISPYSVAISYGRKELTDLLSRYHIPRTVHKGFDQVNISTNIKFNLHDYFSGISVGFKEPLSNFGFYTGLDFKPTYTRVLMKESEELYYQYMDKSFFTFLGAFKDYKLTDYPMRGNWIYTFSLSSGYYFSNKLKGTSVVPGNKFKVIPSTGIKWSKGNFIIKIDLEYFKTPFYRIGPLWLKAGAGYTLYFNKVRAPGKSIKWY